MENTIIEMHEKLKEGFYVAFVSENNTYYPLFKSDSFDFLDDKTVLIIRKNGWKSIINLNLIVEISIKREVH